ncbi:MAG: hypothetical protein B7Z78_02270 [Rhodospirillales bacterium 20-60-12]|nr:MAG: hypothetical protein B7Z78_02270 [Rhodospirillales bacterium 20-60-12]
MRKHLRLLIVIADGEHARFVRPKENNGLYTESSFNPKTIHERTSDLGTDRPGATYHDGSSAHHALAPRHDLHHMEKEKFGYLIARKLNDMSFRDQFDDLAIVAPAHSLSAIRETLDVITNTKVIGTLAKDLVKVPDQDLWEHVRAWVRPTHRAEV